MARGYTEKMLGCGAPEEVVLKPNFSALKDRMGHGRASNFDHLPRFDRKGDQLVSHQRNSAPALNQAIKRPDRSLAAVGAA